MEFLTVNSLRSSPRKLGSTVAKYKLAEFINIKTTGIGRKNETDYHLYIWDIPNLVSNTQSVYNCEKQCCGSGPFLSDPAPDPDRFRWTKF